MSCNCDDYPFEPYIPCYDICTGKKISLLSKEDLKNIFGIPENILAKIETLKAAGTARTLTDYSRNLSKVEAIQLSEIFSNPRPEAVELLKQNTQSSIDFERSANFEAAVYGYGITAYSVKTKTKNVLMINPVIDVKSGRYIATGTDHAGNKIAAIMGRTTAEEHIKKGNAKKGTGW